MENPADTTARKPNRCLVWGGYGWGNTGDDLTLAVALHDLRAVHGNRLHLLTPDSAHTSLAQPGMPLLRAPWNPPRPGIERWLWQLADRASDAGRSEQWCRRWYRLALRSHRRRSADGNWHDVFTAASSLHLVGGGYLTDVFDLRYMLRPVRVARAMGLPVTTSPLGIGPFRSANSAAVVARAMQGAQVAARDEASLEFCRTHGLQAEIRPDDGFRLREVIGASGKRESPAAIASAIGVCIFSQLSKEWSPRMERWWRDALRALAHAFPRQPIRGFCFHTQRSMDFETTRRLFAEVGLDPDAVEPPKADFRAAITSLQQFDAIVSTRFHAAVAASVFAIPCVAVAQSDYYEIKMGSAMRHAPMRVPMLNPGKSAPAFLIQQLQQAMDSTAAA